MDILYAVLGIVFGSAVGIFIGRKLVSSKEFSEDDAIKRASSKAKDIMLDAEKKALEVKQDVENRVKDIRDKIDQQEKKLLDREKLLSDRAEHMSKRERDIADTEGQIEKERDEVKKVKDNLHVKLEQIAGMTKDEAKNTLLKELEEDLKQSMAKKIRASVNNAELEVQEKSKELLVHTMESVATDFVAETTTTTMKIEDEKLKGRIIGKEGRNIRAFEAATGVDVIIDESPEHIGISCFDPLRREIGVLVMRQLIKDGRIHPGRIEEVVEKVKKEIAEEIMKNGKFLVEEGGFTDADPDLVKLLGKMKYRTSYGQSLMEHTLEVMHIGEILAHEVSADVALVKKACLLHDIGKLLVQKVSKPHHHISGDVARKYGMDEKLVNAIEAHHDDIETTSLEATLVRIADAISGARPGARKESYENYIQRIQALEDLVKETGKNKVGEVYAIHAGREIRVIVKPENSTDDEIVILAQKIAKKIEKTQTYPGTIQVTVIRETRAIDTAR